MKKGVVVMSALVVLLALGCKTTETSGSGIKGSSAVVKKSNRQIVDYQGGTLGSEIPEWVKLISEGQYGQTVLSKVMPGLEGKKVFVVNGRGDNLDFVKSWVNLVDIETEVSGAMERVTGKVVTAQMTGNAAAKGQNVSATELTKALDDYRIALQDVRIAGLERVADYWTQIEVLDGKTVTDSYFEYYSVWAMDKSVFQTQLKRSLDHIDETTTETAELKKLVKNKLENELSVATNNPSVAAEADDYIIYLN